MKHFILVSGIFTVALLACLKPGNNRGTSLVDMIFTSTTSPLTVTVGQDIISSVQCFGSDLCYKFSKFDILETSPKRFDIRAKATYPNGKVVCALALYQVDSSITIKTTSAGQYILRFYNRNEIFKSDTVIVN